MLHQEPRDAEAQAASSVTVLGLVHAGVRGILHVNLEAVSVQEQGCCSTIPLLSCDGARDTVMETGQEALSIAVDTAIDNGAKRLQEQTDAGLAQLQKVAKTLQDGVDSELKQKAKMMGKVFSGPNFQKLTQDPRVQETLNQGMQLLAKTSNGKKLAESIAQLEVGLKLDQIHKLSFKFHGSHMLQEPSSLIVVRGPGNNPGKSWRRAALPQRGAC